MNLPEQQSYGPLISKAALPGCAISNEMNEFLVTFVAPPAAPAWLMVPAGAWVTLHGITQPCLLIPAWGPAVVQSETGNVRSRGKDFMFCLMGLVSGARTRSTMNPAGAFRMGILIHFRKAALG